MSTAEQLPRWLKPANRIVKLLHRFGVPLGTIHVLTIPGRTSGQPRSTPVSPLAVDGRRYVIAGLPDSSWAKNARASGRGRLSTGRTHHDVELAEVLDPETKQQVMAAFPTEVPHGVQFFLRIGLVKSADPADFAAASDKVAVFEIHPAPGGRL
jgi:deazaflavin-dependent oxidoreductase (nitroreductase family)